MTRYDVTVYCPDDHIVYDGRTPDGHGVGGGVTVRIRLANALARLGHHVTLLVNCPKTSTFGSVRYRPWRGERGIDTEVLILTTSGGAVDLRPILAIEVRARLRLVWVHGVPAPRGLDEVGMDFLCAPSNFVRRLALREWGIAPEATFVAYNAADARRASRRMPWRRSGRDPFRLVYASHPSKGLDAAIGVLRILRRREPRFELHVYGGTRLWGEPDQAMPSEPGVVYHGLIGQAQLAAELRRASFSVNLQAREEPFGLTVLESMRAGCMVVASPVGAYPEIVRHGHSGFLVSGDHRDEQTWRQAADVITYLIAHPDHAAYARRNAMAAPWDWDTMARVWAGHWQWALGRSEGSRPPPAPPGIACAECGGEYLALADGYHCTACGLYSLGP